MDKCQVVSRILNEHSKCLVEMLQIGEAHGQKKRAVAILTGLLKDQMLQIGDAHGQKKRAVAILT